ncbi:hypothetical protein D9M70_596300 [compost metagenome]
MSRVDIARLRQVDADRHAGATDGQRRQHAAAEFGKLVVQHDLATVDPEIGVHDALAVLGHLVERVHRTEGLLVEGDGGKPILDADVGLDRRNVGSECHATVSSCFRGQRS